jgi:isopentenyl-diphosphate delta-isomerase type 1
MSDSIILVNNDDEKIGYGEKLQVHLQGQLHRAFSLFIVNKDNEVLIQKRAHNKYHSGGLWTNACCSHFRKGEVIETSIRKRVFEELGLDISDSSFFEINELGKFRYFKQFDEYAEHEIDHVFVMYVNNHVELQLNTDEVEDVEWIDLRTLGDWMVSNPEDFTAWFFAVYNMYIWREIWNPTTMCSPISDELSQLLRRRMEKVDYVGPFI